jgi:hypothetical protein
MKTAVSQDADRLTYTRGGGSLTAIGIPLLALGAFLKQLSEFLGFPV